MRTTLIIQLLQVDYFRYHIFPFIYLLAGFCYAFRILYTIVGFILSPDRCYYLDVVVGLAYRDEATELYWLEQSFFKVLICQTGRLKNVIRPGSSEAEGLSKEDLARRDALLREKKKKLTDPNYFISDVRLCLRNLPLHVSDDDLKSACMKFLKKSTDHRILECRIMRNLQPGRQQYRSLGYGFVAFTNHENALSVLYGLNNNPNAFPPSNRRPIVEFSLENMRALQLKQKRAEKCLILQSKTKESSSSTPQLFAKNIERNSQKTKSILTSKSSNSTIYKKSKMNNNPNYINKLKKKLYLSKNNTQRKSSILPKHFGPKKRHRHRGRLAAAAASKPKQKTRKQKRAAKNT
ncbi:unnamed protein product [Schistosoma haematobium]|nr:unnamed protein product [Schistosoma haematobium]